MAKKINAGKEFAKLGKEIKKMAKKEGLIAFHNRLKLFIHGKPARRWWFVDKGKDVLISAEYGLVDQEAVEFLKRGQKK
ncbi:MAG: hypothetical protein ABFR63_08485 [Thermodesulfobacteriota bacterium]